MDRRLIMRKYLCWLFGHNYLCAFMNCYCSEKNVDGKEAYITRWVCGHCGKQMEVYN